MRTRATAFLRRPVPRLNVSANLDIPSRVESDRLRLLCLVAMVSPGINPKALEHVCTQRVALKHAAHGVCDREGRVALLLVLQRPRAQAARIPRVAGVLLGPELAASDFDLGRVDDDHVVARVEVGRECGLVLAAEDLRDGAGKAAQNLIRGIDHEPIAFKIFGFRRPRLLFAHTLPSNAPCARPAGFCLLTRLPSKSLPSMSGPPAGPFSALDSGLLP